MLNENLAKTRKERGLTQETLAAKLNVVRQTISKWEKGTAVPDADTLCRIADALDVPVSTLLGDSKPEEKLDTTSIAESLLPDKIEVSNVCFNGNDNGKALICSFVPSIGNDDIIYTVSLHSKANSSPDAMTVSEYENGICTATFDKSKLSEYEEYSVVLSIDYKGDVRNLMLAEVFNFQENSYSWISQWN